MAEVDEAPQSGDAGVQTTDQPQPNDEEQSSGSESTDAGKKYKVLDKEMTPDELYSKYQEDQSYITRTQQENKKLKQQLESQGSFGQRANTERVVRSVAQDVPSDVREAVIEIVRPELDRVLRQQKENESIEQGFGTLAAKWDGKDGKPKYGEYSREEVLDYMGRSGSKVFDPEVAFELLHKEEIRDWEIKQALKNQRGSTQTERTGGNVQSPSRKQPKNFSEAGNALVERMRNSA